MNRDDGVFAIVFATKHLLDFAAFDEIGELLDALRELRTDIFALTRPIDEHAEVVCFGFECRDQLDFFLDAAAALEDFLRLDLVVPEIGRRCAGLYLGKLVARTCGFKDSSGDRQRALRDPDTGVISHRERLPRIPPESSAASVSAAQM
jgi:hypothetical protein